LTKLFHEAICGTVKSVKSRVVSGDWLNFVAEFLPVNRAVFETKIQNLKPKIQNPIFFCESAFYILQFLFTKHYFKLK
jgi:hypothetical protein